MTDADTRWRITLTGQGCIAMKTGLDVLESGLYVSECCLEEKWLEKDEIFPRCWICKGLTEWESVELPQQMAA